MGDQVTTMDRLTAEDQLMLWPDEIWPQDIGALAVLDGGALLDPDGQVRIAAVRQAVEARLHLVPRFRQLLCVPGRWLGPPLWVDAPVFDVADHVGVVPLPAPGDEATLLRTVERLRRRRLDRSRPLWEMRLLAGMPDNRVGLFIRMHHAMADGIAGVAAASALLDAGAATPLAVPPPWTPVPAPTRRDLLADNLRRHISTLGRAFSVLARPVAAARRLSAAWPAMRELMAEEHGPGTSLNRMVGPDRRFALVRTSVDVVKQVAHGYGATVNDVLLAATAGGLRALLRSRGEPVDDLAVRVYVPVTLRRGQLGRALGNLISQMVVPLPLGGSDPGRRLTQIAVETAARKARSRPSLGSLFRSRIIRRAFLRAANRHPVNVTTADLPGPMAPVNLVGARVLEVFPVLPLIANVSLGVGALSYSGQLTITVVADGDGYPDLDVFVAGLRDELRALGAVAPVSSRPSAARSVARRG